MREIIGNRVHKLRTRKAVTQEELAKAVDVTRQTIIAIEKGDYTPSVCVALKIAKYFKKPVEKIFYIDHCDE